MCCPPANSGASRRVLLGMPRKIFCRLVLVRMEISSRHNMPSNYWLAYNLAIFCRCRMMIKPSFIISLTRQADSQLQIALHVSARKPNKACGCNSITPRRAKSSSAPPPPPTRWPIRTHSAPCNGSRYNTQNLLAPPPMLRSAKTPHPRPCWRRVYSIWFYRAMCSR